MRIHTNKFGETTISHAPVTQTLETRVHKALATYGLSTRGRTCQRAMALVEAHPSLSAKQAVDFLVSRL